MNEPKLKDLVKMLDFFDPELPVIVLTGEIEPVRRVTKVKLTADEKQLLIFTEPVPPGDVKLMTPEDLG